MAANTVSPAATRSSNWAIRTMAAPALGLASPSRKL
jgi:hypothetical protein